MATISSIGFRGPPTDSASGGIIKLEEGILTFLPSCLVFLLTPALFLHRADQSVRIRRGWLLWLKLCCATGLVVIEITSIAQRCTSLDFSAEREFPTCTIDLIIVASVAFALYQEYSRTLQASVLLGLHLAFGIVIEFTKSRSYFRLPDVPAIGYLSVLSTLIRLLLLVLNEIPKGATLVDGHLKRSAGRELSSGFWGRSLFLWLNSTLLLGFRTRLTLDDLDELDPEFKSERLAQQFKDQWSDAGNRTNHGLATICSRVLMQPILAVAVPRFIFAVCSLAQPFVLQRFLVAVQTEDLAAYTRDSVLQAFVLLYFAIAASRASYNHMSGRLVTRVRGILVAAVLDKAHTLSQSESEKTAALTLMNKDAEGVAAGVAFFCEIPFCIFEAILGTACLAFYVGQACLAVLLPLGFSMTFSALFSKYSPSAMAIWNDKTRHRVSETSKVLLQMKVIKMLGLGPTISAYLQRLRDDEIATARSFQAFRVAVTASQVFTSTIAPVLVVGAAFYWTFMGKLSAVEVFPSLAAVAFIQRPLYTLLYASARSTAMFSCLDRIRKYLELEEELDQRILVEPLLNTGEKTSGNSTAPAIEFIDVTLLSHDSEREVLQQANFALKRGSITAALGPSGSGKSALLQSLVGDANVGDGFIYIEDGVIGYADQSPWIRNVSVRENIVGALAFDAIWYSTILRVCLLLEDLNHLPGGDRYVAGTNGMKLSGGQRHRISLARALYCRAQLLVLDDIFSALDRRTAVSILFQLCGEDGLLRNAGCTVVFATYLPESLEVADQLLLLDGHGGITMETDFHEEWFQENLAQALHNQTPTIASDGEDREKAALQRSREFQHQSSGEAVQSPRSVFNLSLYKFFLDCIGRRVFAAWVLSVFLVSFGDSLPDIFIRVWLSVAPENMAYFLGYVGASIFATLATVACQGILLYVIVPRISAALHGRLTDVVMHSTLAFFSCTDTGSILNRYNDDMTALMMLLPGQTYRFFYMLFHIILQILVIASGTTFMATVLPFIGILAGFVLYCFVQTSRQVRSMEQDCKTPLYNHFTETAGGLRHIKALGWRSSNIKIGLALLDISQRTVYTASCLRHWLSLAADLIACGTCYLLTCLSLKHRLTTPITAIGLSYMILITLGLSLEYFFDSWADLDNAVNAFSRLRDFLQNTPTEPELSDIDLPTNWPTQGQIVLRNVTAKYSSNGPARLEELSLRIAPGHKVGITGRSGSGKSSLFMSMLGFLDYSGTIEVDGVDISKITKDTLRSRIITISQDHLDLGGTIRNNLLPFQINPGTHSAITDDEVNDVLDNVGLRTRIENRGGLDAQVSKAGLSHGQLQLLSIARAILRGKETQSRVILMDEATSNVDLETDAQIQKVLREAFSGCTILMIAHRLETIRDANMFVELAHGKANVLNT